ncbi:unnamed protein product [Ectocarpus sp. CCAP 1310/34]|nr:unnamed protein product [Ectocarpus sp. CCAP 1310/34]
MLRGHREGSNGRQKFHRTLNVDERATRMW